ncbi:MAG: GIY-YIG nuclease family protein [Endozoicomonadaceae bacterium]|nr:GIY-YIG nuclease family protein [Endozoicomonadaceae bacterium]
MYKELENEVNNFNALFTKPMVTVSKRYYFDKSYCENNNSCTHIEDNSEDQSFSKAGVYVFFDKNNSPIYCGETYRELWHRIYDHFKKRTEVFCSEVISKSALGEPPFSVVLYSINFEPNSDDYRINLGMGYALEYRLLKKFETVFKYNKKGK